MSIKFSTEHYEGVFTKDSPEVLSEVGIRVCTKVFSELIIKIFNNSPQKPPKMLPQKSAEEYSRKFHGGL